MRRTLSVLLATILLLALLPSARAEEEREIKSGDFRYVVLDDGTVEITDWIFVRDSHHLTSIPSMLDGKKVTRIGDYAFYNEYTLRTITVPDGVTRIGDHAFGTCQNLTAVTIPDSVSEMGVNPFGSSRVLTSIIVSPENPYFATIDGVLYEKAAKKLVCYPCAFSAAEFTIPQGIAAIGDYAFAESELTAVTIPDSVTSIGDYAFEGCGSLTDITIPNSVTAIGNYAFASCWHLETVTIPDSVTSIGDFAFDSCRMTSVTIPDSVSKIGKNPFQRCGELTSINVSPTHPYYITVDGVLYEKAANKLVCYPEALSAEEFTIPTGTAAIGDSAFRDCRLTTVTIPDSVTSIGDYAFESCGLTDITIPNSVTAIGDHAFERCGFTDITIPNSVTTIGDHAFDDCRGLTDVTIPNGVTSIGESAFFNCWNLSTVTIPDSVTYIGTEAFSVQHPDFHYNHINYGLSLIIPYGGYAEAYCKENGLNYTYQSNNDWLFD